MINTYFFIARSFEYETSVGAWRSILCLSDKWEMEGVRKLAVKQLGRMALDPAEKVALWRQFHIEVDWVRESIKAVCTREEYITGEYVEKFGPKLTAGIAQARERIISERTASGRRCSSCSSGHCHLRASGSCQSCGYNHCNASLQAQNNPILAEKLEKIILESIPEVGSQSG
jgi:hypothetical protein